MIDQAPGNNADLRIYLLGPLWIEWKEDDVRMPTRKAEGLLAYLVLNPGEHTREQVAALFWGDSPEKKARNSLRNALTFINRHLLSGIFLADRQTVALNEDFPLWVDALAFRSQVSRYLEDPAIDPEAVDFDLYRGPLLADFYQDWIFPHRRQLQSLYLDGLFLAVQQRRSQGEYEKAFSLARKVLEVDRANERAQKHLMFCDHALGKRSEALNQYQLCRKVLQEELGIQPASSTVELAEWIQEDPGESQPSPAEITNLPHPLTSFIGREDEKHQIFDPYYLIAVKSDGSN